MYTQVLWSMVIHGYHNQTCTDVQEYTRKHNWTQTQMHSFTYVHSLLCIYMQAYTHFTANPTYIIKCAHIPTKCISHAQNMYSHTPPTHTISSPHTSVTIYTNISLIRYGSIGLSTYKWIPKHVCTDIYMIQSAGEFTWTFTHRLLTHIHDRYGHTEACSYTYKQGHTHTCPYTHKHTI